MKQLNINKNILGVLKSRQKRHEKEMEAMAEERKKLYYEMKEYFGKNLYWIFFKPYGTEENVREALSITKAKKKDFPYFLGIIKKLIY